ncbi:MAG TPA: PadR family transcriptional regulator [Pseudonocardia sp.]
MGLRHAVLAALLDRELSGYQLTKLFDVGVADFWYAVPQQLYTELTRSERDGLISGREVIQHGRPNKRMYRITDPGLDELAAFAERPSKPQFLRDDLLVKVYAAEAADSAAVLAQLAERVEQARAKIALLDQVLARIRGDQDEQRFLATAPRVGPYLTCHRGRLFEQEHLTWCEWAADVLRGRADSHAGG